MVELHDPERFNTMGRALGDDMTHAMDHLRRQGGVCALALQGAGSVFCAGGNPYGSSGPTLATSLASSSQQLLASVQVCAHGSTGLCACSGHLLTSHLCAVQNLQWWLKE